MQSILGNTRKADITFRANGRIDISAGVAKHLQLCRGDAIDVFVDRGEFYLYVKSRSVRGRHNARVFPTNKRGNHFRCSSSKLCLAILKECGVSKRVGLCIGEPIESSYGILIPIITKNILQYD